MPLINALRTNGDVTRAVLDAGEVLFALSPAKVGYGVTSGPRGAEPQVDRTQDRIRGSVKRATDTVERVEGDGRARRGVVRVLLSPLALLGGGPVFDPGAFPASLLGGRTCEGPGGSTARNVQQAIESSRESFVAVTDRRVVLLNETAPAGSMEVTWEVPRALVADARRRPRLLARARFELRFADGSRIVLSAWPPNVGSWHPKQVVEALR